MVLEIVKAAVGHSGPPVYRGLRRWRHGGLVLELAAPYPGSTKLLSKMLAGGVVKQLGLSPWRWGSRGSTVAAAGSTHLAVLAILYVLAT